MPTSITYSPDAEGELEVHALVGSGGSFGASSLQQELGLGLASGIQRLEVQWPGGETQVFEGLPMDRILRITEGQPDFELLELPKIQLGS